MIGDPTTKVVSTMTARDLEITKALYLGGEQHQLVVKAITKAVLAVQAEVPELKVEKILKQSCGPHVETYILTTAPQVYSGPVTLNRTYGSTEATWAVHGIPIKTLKDYASKLKEEFKLHIPVYRVHVNWGSMERYPYMAVQSTDAAAVEFWGPFVKGIATIQHLSFTVVQRDNGPRSRDSTYIITSFIPDAPPL